MALPWPCWKKQPIFPVPDLRHYQQAQATGPYQLCGPWRLRDAYILIRELNHASDFINYKLLHNFYAVTHKQGVNLWQVFERDIFPFLLDDANR